ncbi:hypothetical protein TNCV_1626261 [Trichonephila clavipes]|nr:hypothetical protein TNCV_1626261 [Trichonephila clavipes]
MARQPWLKIKIAGGKNATERYRGLLEVCGKKELSYRTVALCVKAFRLNQNETVDLQRTRRPSIPQDQIDILRKTPLHRPSMDYLGIILRGLSQSSNGVAHNEEMSEHEEKCSLLDSTSTHRSAEMAPVFTGWHTPEDITQ